MRTVQKWKPLELSPALVEEGNDKMSNLAYETEQDEADSTRSDTMSLRALRPVPRISIQAFCETEGVAIPIERAGEDRRMTKAHVKVHMGGISTAIEFYQTAPTPNLIILESRREPRDLIEALKQLAEFCDSNSKVVVIGHYNDVWLYRELIRSGISEYIVAPISMADIVGVISSIFVDPQAEPIGRSIAFIGAKGGVGSSTLAHNAAWAMSSLFGSEVVVADLDLAFGTANINFDQDPAQGIAEAVFAPERIDEVYLDRLLATCAEHLSLLAAPSTLDRVYDFDPGAFTHLIDTAQRSAPVIVLDIPHAWNGWTKNTLMKADEIVITATPELANLRNTKNLVDMLKKLRPNDLPPKLVINQAGVPKRPEITAADFAEPLGIQPMAVLPFDPQLFGNASNNGRMLGETDAKHAISQMINEMAHILTGRSEIKAKKKTGLESLIGKLKLGKK
jgi:pilus assembly protein CpaE